MPKQANIVASMARKREKKNRSGPHTAVTGTKGKAGRRNKERKGRALGLSRNEGRGDFAISCASIVLLSVAIALGAEAYRYRTKSLLLTRELNKAKEELEEYTKLYVRTGNPTWMPTQKIRSEKLRRKMEGDPKRGGYRANETVVNGGLDPKRWHSYLIDHTPLAFHATAETTATGIPVDKDGNHVQCFESLDHVAMTPKDWDQDPDRERTFLGGGLKPQARRKAAVALKECGFLALDSLISPKLIDNLRDAYERFRETERAKRYFRYPCQGKGRVEFMLPFEPPFNNTDAPYHNPVLRQILLDFLGGPYKLELMTVINSSPGSGDQRWHQGWRYLFHPDEQLPPYSIVVGIPLDDVSLDMGPTQFCPRRKLRFYHGFRCDEGEVVSLGSTKGSVLLFDYKLLHRGPANHSPRFRPMISMVFSKMFFVNSEAYVNRGISLLQTLHQRRYWEEFVWHPEGSSSNYAYFDV